MLDLWAGMHKIVDAMKTSFILLIIGFWLSLAAITAAAINIS